MRDDSEIERTEGSATLQAVAAVAALAAALTILHVYWAMG